MASPEYTATSGYVIASPNWAPQTVAPETARKQFDNVLLNLRARVALLSSFKRSLNKKDSVDQDKMILAVIKEIN